MLVHCYSLLVLCLCLTTPLKTYYIIADELMAYLSDGHLTLLTHLVVLINSRAISVLHLVMRPRLALR